MAFHETRFPIDIALDAVVSIRRPIDVVTLSSGREERNAPWAGSRRRYEAGYGVKTIADLQSVIAFFEARGGALNGFRWRDPLDWTSAIDGQAISPNDQPLGAGDGVQTVFQLIKCYESGAEIFDRPISKPVTGTVRVSSDGAELSEGADFTVDTVTGIVSFTTPPAAGASLTAGFEFDTPVRFDGETIQFNLAAFRAGQAPSIPLIELFTA